MAHHFVVDRLAGLHQGVRNAVGLDKMRAEGDEHLAHDGLARGNGASEADFQHKFSD
jgi:hypothetical protein